MQIHETAENLAPVGASCREVITEDGVHLRVLVSPVADSQGTVVILGGRSEYFERYFETIRDLHKRNFNVVTFDWRGQGGSQRVNRDPLRGFVRHFRDYEKDLQAVLTRCVANSFSGPVYAMAHSTGGLILLNHLRSPSIFSRAIITAPLIDFVYGAWPPGLARFIAKFIHLVGLGWIYLPGRSRGPLKRNEFDGNVLTTDRLRWDRDITTIEKFPSLAIGGPTYSWFNGALDFISTLKRWPPKEPSSCPVLLVAAGNDQVVHDRAARHFADVVPGVSYIEISDSEHEILMERNVFRRQFWSAFDSFIGFGAEQPRP